MRVGLVTYALDRPLTGIARYTLELGRALAALDARPEIVLLAAGGLGPLAEVGLRAVPLPGCRLLPGLLTLGQVQIRLLARALRLDVVHDPTGVMPFGFGVDSARRVVTVHDAFAWSCPGTSSLLDTLIYRHWLPHRLPSADAVITVSGQSRDDIQRYLGVAAARLRVIPYGVAARFQPVPVGQARAHCVRRFDLSGPYALYVGALTRRKNIERALEAFALLRDDFPRLRFVLAGPRSWKQTPVAAIVARLGLDGRVQLTGPLTDFDLPALYSAAELFVFPSLYEGFGLPPLEAMACGTPVVCSSAGAMPEVVGDAALTVDPYDVPAMAQVLRNALGDAGLRETLRAKGLARARLFTWERAARETVAVYRQVLEEPYPFSLRSSSEAAIADWPGRHGTCP